MLKSWAKLFRVVNLPTVPGDVMAGAAAACVGAGTAMAYGSVAYAAAASVLLYMFGLADNDIVGAGTDAGRPIPDGEISLRSAKVASALCLCGAAACGVVGHLPKAWWVMALALATTCANYNRAKWPFLMGLCRGFNVLCGGAAVAGWRLSSTPLLAVAAVWALYITAVTKYSEGEECDPAKKRRVGLLIGALVYLQLIALLAFPYKPLLVAGAVLLAMLRLAKKTLPEVSAS